MGKRLYIVLLLLSGKALLYAQTDEVETGRELPTTPPVMLVAKNGDTLTTDRASFVIGAIIITGNKKTKPYIIERELPFKEGDSISLPVLVEKFEFAREQLINTKLFHEAIVSLKSFHGFIVDISIEVKERWYIFPVPYFKPIDRNLSTWADKGYSFNRVNYGAKFFYNNFTGRNDKLKIWLITGYNRQVQLSYDQPYADKTLKHGYGISVSYLAEKEINAGTINNEQQFIKADSISYAGKFLSEQFSASLGYYYRPALYTRHFFRAGISTMKIDSAVTVVNPSYFKDGRRSLVFPELSYGIAYQKIDYAPYPLKGIQAEVGLLQRGIGNAMHLTQLTGKYIQAWKWGRKSSFHLQFNGVLRLPFDQPFYNQRIMGYGDWYLRGMEKYVIDGVGGAMVRNTLRRELLNFNLGMLQTLAKTRIPFQIYAKTYADWGYVYNKNMIDNSLVNKMLYSAGAGLDVVTFYDLVFRFEYSVNSQGKGGFFFHIRNDF